MKKNKEIKIESEDLQASETSTEEVVTDETISVSSLQQEDLRRALSDAQEYKDKYLRSLAEMENLRKRLGQEKSDMIAFAIDNMLSEFLMPLENLENALNYTDNLSDELKNWALGFKMIASQFKDVLETHGVVSFDSKGMPFDPYFHEAIELIESTTEKEGYVIEEIQKGYKHGDRVLRVAKVKVAKAATLENL